MNSPHNNCLSVRLVTTISEFEGLRSAWESLEIQCPQATIFQSFSWNFSWWSNFGKKLGRRLSIITFWCESPEPELVAIAPMMTGFWYATPCKRISFIGTGTSDYLDLLALPSHSIRAVEQFHHWLANMGGWWVADLQQLRPESLFRTVQAKRPSSLTFSELEQEPCPFIKLEASWTETIAVLGKKTRSNIGYYDRGLSKTYQVHVGMVETPEELRRELETLFDLHERRWKKRMLPGVFTGAAIQRFHHEAAAKLLELGKLRLFYLQLDGASVASLYCYAADDRFMYYQGGFDPDLAHLSVGTVLTSRAIQQAIAEKKSIFDFLRGDEPYKQKWTKNALVNCRHLVTKRGGWRHPVALAIQQLADRTEYKAKRLARKLR